MTKAQSRWLMVITALGTLVVAVIVSILVAYVAADAALRPDPPKNTPYLDQFPFPVEEVEFQARDKTELAGWFLAAAPPQGEQPSTAPLPTVLLMHGYGGTRDVMLPYADFLSKAGFHVFFFDARGVGHSAKVEVTFGEREKQDVLGALDYLSKRPEVDQSRIAIMGVELGGSVGIMAAAEDPRVASLVVEAPYASLELALQDALDRVVSVPTFLRPATTYFVKRRIAEDITDRAPIEAVAKLNGRPLFIIEDSEARTDQTRAIFNAAGQPKSLWVAHGAALGDGLKEFPIEYVAKVVEFLRSNVGATPRR
ncbi:MAG: alpha/beta fold hydrolase [Chloroflexota bacterium]